MLAQHQYTHLLLKAATKEPPHPETDGLHLEMLRALSRVFLTYPHKVSILSKSTFPFTYLRKIFIQKREQKIVFFHRTQ